MAQDSQDNNKKVEITLNVGNKIITVLCCVCCGIVDLIAIIALIFENWSLENFLKNFLVLGLMCFICHASIVLYAFTDLITILWTALTTPFGKSIMDLWGIDL